MPPLPVLWHSQNRSFFAKRVVPPGPKCAFAPDDGNMTGVRNAAVDFKLDLDARYALAAVNCHVTSGIYSD